jgi:uncharacterized membrane protein YhaH (DUF805 family)
MAPREARARGDCSVKILRWYVRALRRYADFNGRSGRAEFWSFTLVSFVLDFSCYVLTPRWPAIGLPVFALLMLFTATPALSVSTRRLHDTGRTGWPLAKTGALGAAQAAFWLGVGMTHGRDLLAWAAAISATLAQMILAILLYIFYCLPGDRAPNLYGDPPKPLP